MKTTTLICTACGAPIAIPEDVFTVTCNFCGATIGVERGTDYVVLKSTEMLANLFGDSGEETRRSIRENTRTIQNELQVMQIQQEINSTKVLLDNVQREIRSFALDGLSMREAIEIPDLHSDEFQYMDKIRLLENRLHQPDTNDMKACLAFEIRERDTIESEISVLQKSTHSNRKKLIKALKERKEALQKHIMLLKANMYIKALPSFHYRMKSDEDIEELFHHLAMYEADEEIIVKHCKTAEGMYIFKEIKKREKALQEKIVQLEEQQANQPHANQREISNHNHNSSSSSEKASRLYVKSKAINLAGFQGKRPGKKSLLKGVALSLLIMLGTVILGFILTAIIASIFSIPAKDSPIWVLFLTLTLGFLFAARSFFIYAVPDFTIQGIAGLPDIKLETWKSGVALDNPIIVKLLVAINITILIILITFFLLVILLPLNNDLSMLLVLASIPLSITGGVLGYIKTIC